jgi:hypothetical protein
MARFSYGFPEISLRIGQIHLFILDYIYASIEVHNSDKMCQSEAMADEGMKPKYIDSLCHKK